MRRRFSGSVGLIASSSFAALGGGCVLDHLDQQLHLGRLAAADVRVLDRARSQGRRHVHQVIFLDVLAVRQRGDQRGALVQIALLQVRGAQMCGGVAQGDRASGRVLPLEDRREPRHRQADQERELLLHRVTAAHHAVLEDAPVQLVGQRAHLLRRRGRRGIQARRRLAQRGGVRRIAAQVVDDGGADQLHGARDLVELVLGQQLAENAPRQQAVLDQRAPHLGQAIGAGQRLARARRRPCRRRCPRRGPRPRRARDGARR